MSKSNARYFIWSNGLQNLGDQIVAAKTVLPALFSAAGVPAFFTGLLTPIPRVRFDAAAGGADPVGYYA